MFDKLYGGWAGDELGGDRRSQIRGDERLLEFVEGRGVDAFAAERCAYAVDEARGGARKSGLETLEPGSHQTALVVAMR